jgi:hypothetical protein
MSERLGDPGPRFVMPPRLYIYCHMAILPWIGARRQPRSTPSAQAEIRRGEMACNHLLIALIRFTDRTSPSSRRLDQ